MKSGHGVLQAQANWALKQLRAGGRCALFIATRERLLLLPGAELAKRGCTLNEHPLSALLDLSVWRATPPVTDGMLWVELREKLTT